MYVKKRTGGVEAWRPPDHRPRHLHLQDSDEEKGQGTNLEALFTKVIRKRTDGLRADNRIPQTLRNDFTRSIESYQRTAPALLAKSARQMEEKLPESPGQALSGFRADLSAQTDRLHGIEMVHGEHFQEYLMIVGEMAQEDYLFVSERSSDTCQLCEQYHGEVFSKQDIAKGAVPIPPVHLNCRCSLVALDSAGFARYNNRNSQEMLLQLQSSLDVLGGAGLFTLDLRFVSGGINPSALTRVEPHIELPILGLDPKVQEVYRELAGLLDEMGGNAEAALTELGEDAAGTALKILHSSLTVLDHFFRRGQDLWANAAAMAEENPLLAALLAADAFAFGLPSALFSELSDRWDAFFEESNPTTLANLLTLGLADAFYGTLNPEELWSPEHMADIYGVMLTLLPLALGGKVLGRSVSSADEAARGLFDELTGGTRSGLTQSQIDEILRLERGERPNPSTYLSSSYINSHLAQFEGGATKIVAQAPNGTVGASGGTYVFPSALADDLIRQAGGNVSKLEELLGLPAGSLGNQPVRVDISNPTGLRMPTGNEGGVNSQWLPGGYTSGGVLEAVIDPVPAGNYMVRRIE